MSLENGDVGGSDSRQRDFLTALFSADSSIFFPPAMSQTVSLSRRAATRRGVLASCHRYSLYIIANPWHAESCRAHCLPLWFFRLCQWSTNASGYPTKLALLSPLFSLCFIFFFLDYITYITRDVILPEVMNVFLHPRVRYRWMFPRCKCIWREDLTGWRGELTWKLFQKCKITWIL